MLISLHVKNLALIEEEEIIFTEGLNILTGETGAGKSILLGSVHLALGAKADKDYIRSGAEYALVELVFEVREEKQRLLMEQMDLPAEADGTLVIQRKIMPSRSVCKVNGETVGTGQLRNLASVLLDIHGQHEHQSLLKPANHKEILDGFGGKDILSHKEALKSLYHRYAAIGKELEKDTDETVRRREADLLAFEIEEITEAALQPGEDDRMEQDYQKMRHMEKIKSTLILIHGLTGYEQENGAGEGIGKALREIKSISSLDEEVGSLEEQLRDIDSLLNDFNRQAADYLTGLEWDEEIFRRTEERLNQINHLKSKYGETIAEILSLKEEKKTRLQELEEYENHRQGLWLERNEKKEQILKKCKTISDMRHVYGSALAEKMRKALEDLNFQEVRFRVDILSDQEAFGGDGYDRVVFMIAPNQGEELKPLQQVASGGELSRIMLALKTVQADKNEIHTLIFDEVDAGISGKTAWRVSEKLGLLSMGHQVICITHLPQIAAMADAHYLISKTTKQDRTITSIQRIGEEESMYELARLLGSDTISDAVMGNAREMKELAKKSKKF